MKFGITFKPDMTVDRTATTYVVGANSNSFTAWMPALSRYSKRSVAGAVTGDDGA